MKPYDLYAKLELISPEIEPAFSKSCQNASAKERFFQAMSNLGQVCLNFLCGNTEPKIVKQYDHHGNPFYRVYDPVSRRVVHYQSEQEVRNWLEKRFYLD